MLTFHALTNVPLSSARTWTPFHHPLQICWYFNQFSACLNRTGIVLSILVLCLLFCLLDPGILWEWTSCPEPVLLVLQLWGGGVSRRCNGTIPEVLSTRSYYYLWWLLYEGDVLIIKQIFFCLKQRANFGFLCISTSKRVLRTTSGVHENQSNLLNVPYLVSLVALTRSLYWRCTLAVYYSYLKDTELKNKPNKLIV